MYVTVQSRTADFALPLGIAEAVGKAEFSYLEAC